MSSNVSIETSNTMNTEAAPSNNIEEHSSLLELQIITMSESQPSSFEDRAAIQGESRGIDDHATKEDGDETSRKRKPEEVEENETASLKAMAKYINKKKDNGTVHACKNQTTADDNSASEEIRERRELRKEQRQTLEDLQNSWLSMKGLDTAALQAERKRHNELFRKVRHAREFKLDAEILSARASNIQELVSASQQTHRFDPVMLVLKLKETVSTPSTGKGDEQEKKSSFDWLRFGREASVACKGVPPKVTFLVGPLSSQASGKKQRRTYTRGSNQEEAPLVEQVLMASTVKEEQDDTPTAHDAALMVKVIKKELHKQCAQAPNNEIDMIPFLVNPQSFTETIENFLNFSHLVKKGKAGVRKGSDGMIYCTTGSIAKKNQNDRKLKEDATHGYYPARQIVMPLSVKDWNSLVEAYGLTKGGLPDRGYNRKEKTLDDTGSLGGIGMDDDKAAEDKDQE